MYFGDVQMANAVFSKSREASLILLYLTDNS